MATDYDAMLEQAVYYENERKYAVATFCYWLIDYVFNEEEIPYHYSFETGNKGKESFIRLVTEYCKTILTDQDYILYKEHYSERIPKYQNYFSNFENVVKYFIKKENKNNRIDKIRGCLYGQAIGDALGLGSEFMSKNDVKNNYPKKLTNYSQIVQDRHRSRWKKGAWTDDTDMMLCIMRAFNGERFDISKIAHNFKDWFNDCPLGIGNNTANVLAFGDYIENPQKAAEIIWNLSRKNSAANGAIMRTSVIGLEKEGYVEDAIDICKLTHFDPRCVGSCVIVVKLIHNLVWEDKDLSVEEIISLGNQYDERIREWVELAYNGSLNDLQLDDSKTMGFTLRTLAAALWCYFHSLDFKTGLIDIVNEGGDADTNAAIACAILGAKYGYKSIPKQYSHGLHDYSTYRLYIDRFVENFVD